MSRRSLVAFFALAFALGFAGGALAEDPPAPVPPPADNQAKAAPDAGKPESSDATATTPEKAAEKPKLERATFGGGCFWCLEAVFERVKGVKTVVSGYAGGTVAKPTYAAVSTGLTGHAEVVQIVYDPEVVTFEKLLDVFWACHDPTTLNSQGPDFGTQYRSIILYHSEAQKKASLKSYNELTAAGKFSSPIVTELVPFRVFYPADKHHQDYFRKNRSDPYCKIYIEPKLQKLMHK